MFTGLIEEVGTVLGIHATDVGTRFQIVAPRLAKETQLGDSIAVNGCCLTVAAHEEDQLAFDLLEETLRCTNLKASRRDSRVNLERALLASARLGGHFVQGHVDCAAQILDSEQHGPDHRIEIELPADSAHYIANKGSIAVNGISLTVADVSPRSFAVWIIPETREHTNLGTARAGDLVNLEFDLIAKYVERMLNRPVVALPLLMARLSTARIVGVILTHADLRRAVRMRNPPDLFELRLDALFAQGEKGLTAVGNLRAPLIITARHPREGGSNQLSARQRGRLLLRFLPRAAYVDIELRSARAFAEIMKAARRKNIGIIASCHDFKETPSGRRLDEIAADARSLGADLLKIVTRTDTPVQLARLLAFFRRERQAMKIAAMGVGKLGQAARRELFRQGSVFTYVHLGHSGIAGQPSLREVRRWKREPRAPRANKRRTR